MRRDVRHHQEQGPGSVMRTDDFNSPIRENVRRIAPRVLPCWFRVLSHVEAGVGHVVVLKLIGNRRTVRLLMYISSVHN